MEGDVVKFSPAGFDDDDDGEFDEDGFYIGGATNAEEFIRKPFDPIIKVGEETVRRGGFGAPPSSRLEVTQARNLRLSREKLPETENISIDIGDFQKSISRRNTAAVRLYIKQGFAVDTVLQSGWTGLMYAACYACPEIVKLLIDHGANVNFNKDMYTVLMAACGATGYLEDDVLEVVNLLLAKEVDVNSYDRYHTTPLIYAAREGRAKVIKELIKAGAQVNKQDNRGWTALSFAVSKRHLAVVCTLLEANADPSVKHTDGQTAIFIAQNMNNVEMLGLLKGKKIDEASHGKLETEPVSFSSRTEQDKCALRGTEAYGITYSELELFLCGLDLSHMVDTVRQQHIDFNTLLRMTDEDLIKMGISKIGDRKKILDGILAVHKKDWEKSSLNGCHSKQLSCAEAIAIVANISKHTKYISTTVSFLQDQIRMKPAIVEQLADCTGPKQLHQHTLDTLMNVGLLEKQLQSLKQQLEQKMLTGNHNPPDDLPKVADHTNERRLLPLVLIVSTCLAVIVWKRETILEIFQHSSASNV